MVWKKKWNHVFDVFNLSSLNICFKLYLFEVLSIKSFVIEAKLPEAWKMGSDFNIWFKHGVYVYCLCTGLPSTDDTSMTT